MPGGSISQTGQRQGGRDCRDAVAARKYPESWRIDSAGLNDALADADIIINTTSLACMQVMPCHVRWTTPGPMLLLPKLS